MEKYYNFYNNPQNAWSFINDRIKERGLSEKYISCYIGMDLSKLYGKWPLYFENAFRLAQVLRLSYEWLQGSWCIPDLWLSNYCRHFGLYPENADYIIKDAVRYGCIVDIKDFPFITFDYPKGDLFLYLTKIHPDLKLSWLKS